MTKMDPIDDPDAFSRINAILNGRIPVDRARDEDLLAAFTMLHHRLIGFGRRRRERKREVSREIWLRMTQG